MSKLWPSEHRLTKLAHLYKQTSEAVQHQLSFGSQRRREMSLAAESAAQSITEFWYNL